MHSNHRSNCSTLHDYNLNSDTLMQQWFSKKNNYQIHGKCFFTLLYWLGHKNGSKRLTLRDCKRRLNGSEKMEYVQIIAPVGGRF
jgi:hypothetical protein